MFPGLLPRQTKNDKTKIQNKTYADECEKKQKSNECKWVGKHEYNVLSPICRPFVSMHNSSTSTPVIERTWKNKNNKGDARVWKVDNKFQSSTK